MLISVGIALGSNLGDREAELISARTFLESLSVGPSRPARIYESSPVDCPPEAKSFLNTAMEITVDDTTSPHHLLMQLQAYEKERGRAADHAVNSDRAIDLDLIYFGDLEIMSPGLILPHPRAGARRFVLEPLCDLQPDLVLPGQQRSIAELCLALPAEGIALHNG